MDLLDASLPDDARHPWEKARYAFFSDALARHGALSRPLKVLDVGAGDGWFARRLATRHPGAAVTCVDSNYPVATQEIAGIRYLRELPPDRFDLLVMLDVLEHVEHDRAFLRALVEERMAPGARLLFSVPAWQSMYSEHDRALKHFRRYSPASATNVLEAMGLRILEKGGLFHSLLAPRGITCALERLGKRGEVKAEEAARWNAPRWVTSLVDGALAVDGAISRAASRRGIALPGLSFWAFAEKV